MQTKNEHPDYLAARDDFEKDYTELIDEAGIAEEVKRCETWLAPNSRFDIELRRRIGIPGYGPRHLPAMHIEANRRYDAQKFERYCRCQRDAIFAVSDTNLRKKLIRIERNFREIQLGYFQSELSEAKRRRDDWVERYPLAQYGGNLMAIAGCLIVILGWKLGGTMGGTAAAVYALTSAIYGSNELQERRSRIAQRTTAEVANLEAALGEIVAKEEVFSELEADTGERDVGPDFIFRN